MPIPTIVDTIVQSNKGEMFKPTLVPASLLSSPFSNAQGDLTSAVSKKFPVVSSRKLNVLKAPFVSSLKTRPDRWGS